MVGRTQCRRLLKQRQRALRTHRTRKRQVTEACTRATFAGTRHAYLPRMVAVATDVFGAVSDRDFAGGSGTCLAEMFGDGYGLTTCGQSATATKC